MDSSLQRPESESKAPVDSSLETQMDSNPEAQMDSNPETQMDSSLEAPMDSNSETQMDSNSEEGTGPKGCCSNCLVSKCRNALSFLSVEPVVFVISLTFGFQGIISQDLLIQKVCHVNLGLNETICSNLSSNPEQQLLVQKSAATISMYLQLLSAFPSILISLFMGPWSDYHGRKTLMISPIVGFFIFQLVYVTVTYFKSLKAEFILLTAGANLFGGFPCFLIGIYGYISDVSRIRSRTSRVAFVDLFLFVAYPLGTFLSSYIFQIGGYYGIYGVSAFMNGLCLLYIVFGITEIQDLGSSEDLREPTRLMDFNNVKSVFQAVFQARENSLRRVLLLLLFGMFLNVAAANDFGTYYLFTRLKFGWTQKDYTLWSSSMSVLRSFITFALMPILSLKLQFHDALIGILGTLSAIVATLILTFSYVPWMFYLGGPASFIAAAPPIILRSFLSKVVPKTEVGRVFSLLSSLEAAVPLVAAPVVTAVYKSSIEYFPGFVFTCFTSCHVVLVLVLIWIYAISRKPGMGYETLHDDSIVNPEDQQDEEQSPINQNPVDIVD